MIAPCSSYNTLTDYWRSPSVSYTTVGAHCDNTLVAGWYRLILNGYSANMLFSAPAEGSCGTHASMWFRGKSSFYSLPKKRATVQTYNNLKSNLRNLKIKNT